MTVRGLIWVLALLLYALFLGVVGALPFILNRSSARPVAELTSLRFNAPTELQALPIVPEEEVIIVRARYHHWPAPCVDLGGAIAKPVGDAFEVLAILRGEAAVTEIWVLPFTDKRPNYPRDLTVGQVLTVRLLPSPGTVRRLQEMERGQQTITVDGTELELDVSAK